MKEPNFRSPAFCSVDGQNSRREIWLPNKAFTQGQVRLWASTALLSAPHVAHPLLTLKPLKRNKVRSWSLNPGTQSLQCQHPNQKPPQAPPQPPPWTVGLDQEGEGEAVRGPQDGPRPGGMQERLTVLRRKRTFKESSDFLSLKLVPSSKEVTKGTPSMPLTREH